MSGLLLDTNVVVWLLLNDREAVSDRARDALEQGDDPIWLSAVSVWEIAIKRSLGKLKIEERWGRALGRLGFEPLPVTAQHALCVEHLPWHHRDPFDRLLVAQASVEGLDLVSADSDLSKYDIQTIW